MRTFKNNMSRQLAGPHQIANSPHSFVNDAVVAVRHWAGPEACAAAMDIDSSYAKRSPLDPSALGDFFASRAQQLNCGEGQVRRDLPFSRASNTTPGSFYRYNGESQLLSTQPGRHNNSGRKIRSSKVRPQEFSECARPSTHADVVGGLVHGFGEQVQETLNKLSSEGLSLDDSFFSLVGSKIEEELVAEQKVRIALKILKTKLRKMKRKSRKVRSSEDKEVCRDSTSEQSLETTPKQSGQQASIDVRSALDKPVPPADLSSPETALRFLLSKLAGSTAQVAAAGGHGSPSPRATDGEGRQPTQAEPRGCKSGTEQSSPTICADRQHFTQVSKFLDERSDNYAFKRSRACLRYAHAARVSASPA